MQSVQDNKSPDRPSEIDQMNDDSISALKEALENVLSTNRAVPLFEFRRLPSVETGDMKDRVDKAKKAVVGYHEANPNPPARFIRKRLDTKFSNIRRQDSPACAAPSNTGSQKTPTPSAGIDSCNVSYQVVDDYFEIRGKDWPDSKLGTNGDGLKTQVRGYGALVDWELVQTPKDPTYQWFAHGKLPIGTKGCVGRAVESAGGGSLGNCQGAG